MATRIRLTRRGRKKLAIYDIIVADSRAPRDGRFIEKIGSYNPNTDPATIDVNEDKALDWLMKGAQPSDTVKAMLSYKGLLLKKHLQVGVNKGAITQDEADAKFEEWKKQKDERIGKKVDDISKKKEADKKARLDAEAKIKEARAEAIQKKKVVAEPSADGEAEEGVVAEEAAPAPDTKETAEPKPAEEASSQPKEEPVAETKEEEKAAEPSEAAKEEEKAPAEPEAVEEEKKEEEAPKSEPEAAAEETKEDAPAKEAEEEKTTPDAKDSEEEKKES